MLVKLPRRIHLDLTLPNLRAALRAVPWRKVARFAVGAAALVFALGIFAAVGGPSFVASYRHAQTVFERYGETAAMSAWLPLTTDGMLVAAIIVMYWRRYRRERVGFLPWFAFLTGMVATLAANLAAADLAGHPAIDVIVGRVATATWPPICLAFTLELTANLLKGGEPRRRRRWLRRAAPSAPVKRASTPAASTPAAKTAKPSRAKGKPGRLSDDELVAKIQAWMAETAQPAPSKWQIRQAFGLGAVVATRVYPLLGIPK